MLSKKFLPAAFATVVFGVSPCFADGDYFSDSSDEEVYQETSNQSGVYALIGAGIGDVNDITYADSNTDFNVQKGFTGEAGLGYRFNSNLRLEATYVHSSLDVEGSAKFSDTKTKSFFLTGLYDIDNDSKWTPYIGLGIGSSNVDTDASHDDSDTAISYQGKAGLSYDLTEKIDIFGDLTYQAIDGTNITDTNIEALKIWRGQLGLRFFF